jgi:nucleoside-diphosphate-sugar epimerase
MNGDMKSIIVTGASGLLGRALIKKMQRPDSAIPIVAVTRDVQALKEWVKANNCHVDVVCSLDDILRGNHIISAGCSVIHCAFARKQESSQLVESIKLVREMLELAESLKAAQFINISSQAVYGTGQQPPWREESRLAPNDFYGMAKVATEELCLLHASRSPMKIFSVRLSSLIENARFLGVWIRSVLETGGFEVHRGGQRFSFLSFADAATGILAMVSAKNGKIAPVYNLGPGLQQSMEEIEQTFVEVCQEIEGFKPKVTVKNIVSNIDVMMDIQRLQELTGFIPELSFKEGLRQLWFEIADSKR